MPARCCSRELTLHRSIHLVTDLIVVLNRIVKCCYALVVQSAHSIIIIEDADPVNSVEGSQEHILSTLVDHRKEFRYRVVR